MKPSPSPNSPVPAARILLKELQEKFPVFGECKPLAIGIDKQLIARMPELDRKALRVALGIHTNSQRYLKSMEKASHRFDLDNNPGDALNDGHRTHAAQVLRERAQKANERRRAEEAARRAEAARKADDEKEQQRREKLEQLAARFSGRK